MHSDEMQHLMQQIEVVTVEGRKMYNAAVDATLESGEVVLADVPLGRGHPGRPLSASELEDKFSMLVEPVLGANTRQLIGILRDFPGNRTIQRAFECVRQAHLSA